MRYLKMTSDRHPADAQMPAYVIFYRYLRRHPKDKKTLTLIRFKPGMSKSYI